MSLIMLPYSICYTSTFELRSAEQESDLVMVRVLGEQSWLHSHFRFLHNRTENIFSAFNTSVRLMGSAANPAIVKAGYLIMPDHKKFRTYIHISFRPLSKQYEIFLPVNEEKFTRYVAIL